MDNYKSHLQEFLFIAIEALNDGIYNKAIAACELALEVDSECVAAMIIMGNVHYCKKNYKVAQSWYEKAFDLYPTSTNLVNLSLVAIQTDDGDFANVLKNTIFMPNNQSVGHELTALLLYKQGKYDESQKYFELALKTGINRPRVFANYGTMLLEKYLNTKTDINDVHKSIEKFNTAIELSLFNKYAMYNRCRAYYTIGEYVKALKDAKELIKFDSEDPGYYYFLAKILIKLKRYKEAMRYASLAHWYGELTNKHVANESVMLCNEINALTRSNIRKHRKYINADKLNKHN